VKPLDAGTRADASAVDALPDILTLQPSISIAPGLYFTCALRTGGTIKCWGYGANGTLGNGGTGDSTTPVDVSSLSGALSIGAGVYDAFAIRADSSVLAWGNDYQGELGDGAHLAQSDVPVVVPETAKVVQISAGETPCALLANTTVVCWGNIPTANNAPPTPVAGLYGVASIAPRSVGFECVAMNDGTVRCWGMDYAGQLGDGHSGNGARSDVPVAVLGLNGVQAVALGAATSCALLSDRTVWCWGSNNKGVLGAGTATALSLTPIQVSGLSDVTSLSAANYTACATLASGLIKCWGDNSFGELGNGSTTDSSTPVAVLNVTTAGFVAVGDDHVCAQLADGSYVCWGGNKNGGLGSITTTQCPQGPCSTTPLVVSP